MSQSILILPFGNLCITIMSLSFSMLVSCVSGLESVSCLGTSKKLSLGCDECLKRSCHIRVLTTF